MTSVAEVNCNLPKYKMPMESFPSMERSFSLPGDFYMVTLPIKSASCDKNMNLEIDAFNSKPQTNVTCITNPIKADLTSADVVKTKPKLKSCGIEMPLKNIDTSDGMNEQNETKVRKKKKWRNIDPADIGMKLTLFPRIPHPSTSTDEDDIHAILDRIDRDYLKMEERIAPFKCVEKYEGKNISDKYIRVDRHRKIQKAHKQVKVKYCRDVKNNDGRKKLYVHHRIIKVARLAAKREYLHYSSLKIQTVCRADEMTDYNTRLTLARSRDRGAPPQDLSHALYNDNVPTDIPSELVSLLITLQHRDLTPEDYDTLLRLDDAVSVKTVPVNKLQSFRTDIVDEACAGDICSVCLDPYMIGQTRKFLPCGHCFHTDCIDMWLQNSSMNCPLDGLSLED